MHVCRQCRLAPTSAGASAPPLGCAETRSQARLSGLSLALASARQRASAMADARWTAPPPAPETRAFWEAPREHVSGCRRHGCRRHARPGTRKDGDCAPALARVLAERVSWRAHGQECTLRPIRAAEQEGRHDAPTPGRSRTSQCGPSACRALDCSTARALLPAVFPQVG